MSDFDYEIEGAPVVFSTLPPTPHNPLRRPRIYYRKPIIALSLYLLITVAIGICAGILLPEAAFWLCLGWSVLYFLIIGKRALIWMVHLYQNKASDRTRLKCVFEPSCSEYMILAVEKYGLFRGFVKGTRRLLRCHPPNGGIDNP